MTAMIPFLRQSFLKVFFSGCRIFKKYFSFYSCGKPVENPSDLEIIGRQAILPPPRGDVSAADVYDGPFALSYSAETKKVDVKAGFLNRNGEWKTVAAASVDPETGYVCVVTQLNDEGEWTDPELAITEPGLESYPVGYCTVTGSGEEQSVTVSSFRVPVAVFLISAVCSTDN